MVKKIEAEIERLTGVQHNSGPQQRGAAEEAGQFSQLLRLKEGLVKSQVSQD